MNQQLENLQKAGITSDQLTLQSFTDANPKPNPDTNAKIFGYVVQDIAQLTKSGAGIYWCINPQEIPNKRAIDNTSHWVCVGLDLDVAKESDETPLDQVSQVKQNLLNKLLKLKYPPTGILVTKNGLQPYWLFTKPFKLSNKENRIKANELYKQIVKGLGDAIGTQSEGDSICRVLRLEGSTHQKNPDQPFQIKHIGGTGELVNAKEFINTYKPKDRIEKNEHPTQSTNSQSIYNYDVVQGLQKLSRHHLVNSEVYDFEAERNGKRQIIINGERSGQWIDIANNSIGGHPGGEGSYNLVRWVQWYQKDMSEDQIRKELDILLLNKQYKPNETEETSTPTLTEKLVELTLDHSLRLLLDEMMSPHIVFTERPFIAIPIKSELFKSWIAAKYYQLEQKGVSQNTIDQVVATLSGKALSENQNAKIHNRIARENNIIYYDIGNDIQVVRIDSQGWEIVTNAPVLFRRFNHQIPQIIPINGGNIDDLLQFTNVKSKTDILLLKTYLVTVFVPDIPRAMLVITGDQGSGKTTLLRLLRSIIDPSQTEVIKLRKNADDLAQLASQHYCLYLDNVSNFSEDISDSLAAFITGTGFSKRKLYTDNDAIIYKLKCAIGLNGINMGVEKADLLDRSLIVELQRITDSNRVDERSFYHQFEQHKPQLLGAVFDLLSQTLAEVENTHLHRKPRMADYALYAATAAKGMGYTIEDFLQAYDQNIIKQNNSVVDASPVAQTVLKFMEETNEWEGPPGSLYEQLKQIADQLNISPGGKYGFPADTGWLTKRLKEVRPNLESLGISYELNRDSKARSIKLVSTNTNAVTNDMASPAVENRVTKGDSTMTALNPPPNTVTSNQVINDSMTTMTINEELSDLSPNEIVQEYDKLVKKQKWSTLTQFEEDRLKNLANEGSRRRIQYFRPFSEAEAIFGVKQSIS